MTSLMTLNEQKIENYAIIASLKSEQWVNWSIEYQVRIFWYQVYQAQLWEHMYESLGKPRDVNKCSQSLAW